MLGTMCCLAVKLLRQLAVNEESWDWLEKVTVECSFPDIYSNTPTRGKARRRGERTARAGGRRKAVIYCHILSRNGVAIALINSHN